MSMKPRAFSMTALSSFSSPSEPVTVSSPTSILAPGLGPWTSVTTATGSFSRIAWAIALNSSPMTRLPLPVDAFDHKVDGTAAGEADRAGVLVGDAVGHALRHAGLDDVHRLGDRRGLDAATRDGPQDLAVLVDREGGSGVTGGRPLGGDEGHQGHLLPLLQPLLNPVQHVDHGIHLHPSRVPFGPA